MTRFLGLVITVAGTVAVILAGRPKVDTTDHPAQKKFVVGVLLAFATSCFWALNTFATARGSAGIDFSVAITVRLVIGMVLCLAVGRFTEGRFTGFMPWSGLRPYLAVFVLEGFLGTLFYLVGLKYSPLAVAATLSSLSPVLSVIFARLFFRERVSLAKALGIIAVVIGLILLVI
jgi:drug/metabolite transporter (DMT)-like permease